jgi:hypothetical protein
MNLGSIPLGWRIVRIGSAYAGDKYWDKERGAWIPVTVNQQKQVSDFAAVIRKGKR